MLMEDLAFPGISFCDEIMLSSKLRFTTGPCHQRSGKICHFSQEQQGSEWQAKWAAMYTRRALSSTIRLPQCQAVELCVLRAFCNSGAIRVRLSACRWMTA